MNNIFFRYDNIIDDRFECNNGSTNELTVFYIYNFHLITFLLTLFNYKTSLFCLPYFYEIRCAFYQIILNDGEKNSTENFRSNLFLSNSEKG